MTKEEIIKRDIPVAKRVIKDENICADTLRYVIEIDRYKIMDSPEIFKAMNNKATSVPDILRKLADLTELAEKYDAIKKLEERHCDG